MKKNLCESTCVDLIRYAFDIQAGKECTAETVLATAKKLADFVKENTKDLDSTSLGSE